MLELINSKVNGFWKEEDGLGTLELILIIGVIIIIALIFKDKISELVKDLLGKVDTKSDEFFPG
ncbi:MULTISPECIES: Flp1 family type IVb pilin [Paenibacillus]|uniref:Flp1 family type IVb pilin n=1 Tax=Paenibacillus TaxID=44249 RepID=UPI0011A38B65|nr:Flp1 family type IVb pilin [Paenibacillus xylanexedens]